MQKHIIRHKSGTSVQIHYFESSEVTDFIKLLKNSQNEDANYAATYVNSNEKGGVSIDPSGYRTYCKIDICNAIYAYNNFFGDYTKISIKDIFKKVISEFEDYEYLYDIVENDEVDLEKIEKHGVLNILPESPKLESRIFSETLDIFTDYLIQKIEQIRHQDAIIVVNKNRISATLKVKRIPALIANSSNVGIESLMEESIRNLSYLNQYYGSLNEETTILELQSIYGYYLSDYTLKILRQKDTTFSELNLLAIFEVGAESEYIRDLPYDWFVAYENENNDIYPKIVLPQIRLRVLSVYLIPIYGVAKYFNIRM